MATVPDCCISLYIRARRYEENNLLCCEHSDDDEDILCRDGLCLGDQTNGGVRMTSSDSERVYFKKKEGMVMP